MSTMNQLERVANEQLSDRRVRDYLKLGLTVGPGLTWLLLLLLFPLVFLVTVSFARVGSSYDIEYTFSVANYVGLFVGDAGLFQTPFVDTFLLSLYVAVATTAAAIAMAYPVAYLLSRLHGRTFRIVLFAILLPFFSLYIVRIYSWYAFFGQSGIINSFLMYTGVVSGPVGLFEYGTVPIIIGLTHAYFPYMLLTLYSSLDGIDFGTIEAARDLGASRLDIAKDIVVPLSSQGLITGSIFVFVPALGSFITPKFLAQGKVTMVGAIIADRINQLYAIGFGSAASLFLIVPCLLGFALIFRYAGLDQIGGA